MLSNIARAQTSYVIHGYIHIFGRMTGATLHLEAFLIIYTEILNLWQCVGVLYDLYYYVESKNLCCK